MNEIILIVKFACRLKDWVAKAADREREKLEKKRERQERRKAEPKHHFHDPEYQKQKNQVLDNLDDALKQGKSLVVVFTHRKRHVSTEPTVIDCVKTC